jgi:hypothetical protein
MATFDQIYDFETAIETVFAQILQTQFSGMVENVVITRARDILDTPRVELTLTVGEALRQRRSMGTPSREIPNAFNGVLSARLVTSRELNGGSHGKLRGLLRYYLSASANLVNGGNLPYHQILEMLPAQSTPQIIDELQQDVSELHYSIQFAINNAAWPA